MVSEGCFPRIQHIGMGSRGRAPLLDGFSWLRQKLFLFFSGTQGRAERECPAAERTLSREELNQRAERLLRSHGDSALRLACLLYTSPSGYWQFRCLDHLKNKGFSAGRSRN